MSKSEYNPKEIEPKWQKKWDEEEVYKAEDLSNKEKYYSLMEFPYPSGDGLHTGHVRGYTAMDVISRKRRMQGYNVLFPVGWDAFGLPTENYAIKTGKDPKVVTKENTSNFRRQFKALGMSFDWSREINTTDPKYYKWTQWIFLKLLENNLAYKAKMNINWCPKDKIGLANEEVVDGKCERCGTPVEKREKEQWMLAITKYADRLAKDLDEVNFWNKIKTQQRNWIGRSEGLIFTSPVKNSDLNIETFSAHFEAFCADTFIVIAPDHPLLPKLVSGLSEERDVLEKAKEMVAARIAQGREDVKELEGIFTGRYTVDPVGNGELPIWVANYALADYGTGIVKCSAHDERDFAFAKKYGIKLKPVLFPTDPELKKKVESLEICYSDMKNGILSEPKEFEGMVSGEVREKIAEYAINRGLARKTVTYKLRDWVFSRQRYWGEPIPVIHCEKCGVVPVPEKDLPVELPHVEKYEPGPDGESPLANISEWVNTKCPSCGGDAKRETDVMPNWAGSSWYFLRYVDPNNDEAVASKENLKYWMPVDWYNGGMEHTTLHLLYSRFWNKFLYDIGVVSVNEPYSKRTSHGLILAEGGEKMSKSKGNVINPDDIVNRFGADTLRLYEMFMGPFDQAIAWSEDSLVGPRRFIEKVWRLREKVDPEGSDSGDALLHQTIKKVSEDIEEMGFNTAVSAMMVLTNTLDKKNHISRLEFESLLKLLAPFAPHVAEELWSSLGNTTSIHKENWPQFDESKLEKDEYTLAVQVNGKMRATLTVSKGESEEVVKKMALELPEVAKWLGEDEPKKVIVVPGKIVSIVL